MIELNEILILIMGLLIIGFSVYLFIHKRKAYYSLAFYVIIATCIFLLLITFFPDLIIGMKISDMDLSTVHHYHSMITNIVIGFSTVIGVGITLIWTSKGELRKNQVYKLLAILLFYFIYVMYTVFIRELSHQIANLILK